MCYRRIQTITCSPWASPWARANTESNILALASGGKASGCVVVVEPDVRSDGMESMESAPSSYPPPGARTCMPFGTLIEPSLLLPLDSEERMALGLLLPVDPEEGMALGLPLLLDSIQRVALSLLHPLGSGERMAFGLPLLLDSVERLAHGPLPPLDSDERMALGLPLLLDSVERVAHGPLLLQIL